MRTKAKLTECFQGPASSRSWSYWSLSLLVTEQGGTSHQNRESQIFQAEWAHSKVVTLGPPFSGPPKPARCSIGSFFLCPEAQTECLLVEGVNLTDGTCMLA